MAFTSPSAANCNNTFHILAPRLTIHKTSSPDAGKVGDDIVYSLIITVPYGTVAYNIHVDDTLPAGQTYIGPATRQVLPNPAAVIPASVTGQTIRFLDGNPDIDARFATVTVIYTFIARITHATHAPPYSEKQINIGRVRWATQPLGPLNQEESATAGITVHTPHLWIYKEQRNVSSGGSFTTDSIRGLPGNVIYYRLTITSDGASPAYTINVTDVLDPALRYDGVITLSAGTVTSAGPTLTWEMQRLESGFSATLILSATIAGNGSRGTIYDSADVTYNSNDVNPIPYDTTSNRVSLTLSSLDCILVPKVYSRCQQQFCLTKIHAQPPPEYILTGLSYDPGKILPGSLHIRAIAQRPGYSRVSLVITIECTAHFKNSGGSEASDRFRLPDLSLDTVLYLPEHRDETPFDVLLDTRSSTLALDNSVSTCSVGVNVLVTLTSVVQLLIPSNGYCVDSTPCEVGYDY